MDIMDSILGQMQSMVQSVFLHYKLGRALVFTYILVEIMTLGILSIAALNFGIDPFSAFLSFLILSIFYTFFFIMAFSYFLYNVVRPRPREKYF